MKSTKYALLVIAIFFIADIPVFAQRDSLGLSIVSEHIKRTGGRELMGSVKSLLKTFTIYKIPGSSFFAKNLIEENILYFDTVKMFSEGKDEFGRKKQATIIDSIYWLYKDGIKNTRIESKYASMVLSELTCEPSCYLWKMYKDFTYEGVELVDDQKCYVVRGYHKYHPHLKESVFYFDTNSYMLVKNVSVGFNRYFIYSDYREQSGIIFPFKEQKYENGKLVDEKITQSIKVNYFVKSLDSLFTAK